MNNNLDIRENYISKIKFCFDKQIKKDFYTTNYFIKSKNILKHTKKNQITTMQFISFNNEPIMMCGSNEIIQLLKFYLPKNKLKKLEIYIAKDGQLIDTKNTPLLVIKGYYPDFMNLENIIDGILSRRCSVSTNCYYAKKQLLNHQQIIYMSDRNINYFDQFYEAYPAYLAGVNLFVTNAQVNKIKDSNIKVVGTMPHALIQQYKNNLEELIKDYAFFNKNEKLYFLLDYENDVLKTLKKIKPFFKNIEGVRLDTSISLVDKSLSKKKIKGVSPELIDLTKSWLIKNKLENKKIIVTSKIDANKIKEINKKTKNVDYYGIGSYFNKASVHVTADLVELNNQHESKFGRKLLANYKKLQKITF